MRQPQLFGHTLQCEITLKHHAWSPCWSEQDKGRDLGCNQLQVSSATNWHGWAAARVDACVRASPIWFPGPDSSVWCTMKSAGVQSRLSPRQRVTVWSPGCEKRHKHLKKCTFSTNKTHSGGQTASGIASSVWDVVFFFPTNSFHFEISVKLSSMKM